MVILKIANWSAHFENNRTRELKKMDWVPVPTKQDGDGYTELVGHKNGAAHLGAWIAIIEVAAKCDPRGTLLREGRRPHDAASLARITRLPVAVFVEAIPRLISIGWLESEVVEQQEDTQIPQEGAGDYIPTPQEGAASRARATQNGMERNGMEGQGTELVSSEPPAASELVMTFPTVGKSKEWGLIQEHVAQLREAFPDLDVMAQCRKARQWCIDNKPKRKTQSGMAKFLFSWMDRAQNSNGGGTRAGPASDPYNVRSSMAAFLSKGEGDGES